MADRRSSFRAATCVVAALLAACPQVQTPYLRQPSAAPKQVEGSYPLKVHLVSGQLLVLQRWTDLPGDSGLSGVGMRYDAMRHPIDQFAGAMPRDSIALLEVTAGSTAHPAGSVILGGFTVLVTAITVICVSDPKSCFGSCPTFYADDDQDRPDAEGFSGSVARSLEATDVDALADLHPSGDSLALTMRNEALETHAVRSVRLLVVPRPTGGRAVAGADGRFRAAFAPIAPSRCSARDGDCTGLVAARDRREWFTRADSTDLGAPDSVDLAFPATAGPLALQVTARQSFVSTFLFYQTLAYAGTRTGDLLAAVERGGTDAFPGPWTMMRRVGRVEVLQEGSAGTWSSVGTFGEPGPIAADQQVVPLSSSDGSAIHLRLRFTRGAWRFDELALVRLGGALEPLVLDPDRVERDGVSDTTALGRLRDPQRYLVTQPGDRYRLHFAWPHQATDVDVFLESRGYYYEWMRQEWLAEEDPAMLALIVSDPDAALRRLAPAYARLEPGLEDAFWASRFERR